MAGLATALNVVGAVGAVVDNLLFGATGAVMLGPVMFFGQEVPERIGIGGAQSLKTHQYPGGKRTLDAMGRDDAPLQWSGIMIGPNAEQRMLALDALRVAGQPLTLTFGTMSYTVVIQNFRGDYRRTNHCLYSISCVVQQDNSAQFGSAPPTASQQIASDAGSAVAFTPADQPSISTAVNAAQTSLAVPGATELGTSAYTTATLAVGTAQTAVNGGIASTGAVLSGLVGGPNGILGQATGFQATAAAVANMAAAADAANDQANLVIASGFLARTATNLANAGA
jgi:hypothetical protein